MTDDIKPGDYVAFSPRAYRVLEISRHASALLWRRDAESPLPWVPCWMLEKVEPEKEQDDE